VSGSQSRLFRVDEGLRQGCLFLSVMGMIKELENETLGVNVSGSWCGALLEHAYGDLHKKKLEAVQDRVGR